MMPNWFSALDFKVGFRMLKRYPAITIAGAVAIAVAVALGTVYFEAVDKFHNPRLHVPDGDRVVSIWNWDMKQSRTERRALHDFATWRGQLKTVEHLGAAVSFVRNLATDDKRIEPVRGADLTANAFRIMGMPPILGRALVDRDQDAAEPMVVVIGARVWKDRFESDPGVLGRSVRVGTVTATIVGVMPDAFAFPMNHRVWMPLRTTGATVEARTGPPVSIFGRLSPGATFSDARAELAVVGARVSAASPSTHEFLRPQISAYEKPHAEGTEWRLVMTLMYAVNTIFLMLLTIMATNVATLVFARTATRSWEITVRSALGATRGRIIGQLFSEALVLASIGTVVGLLIARLAMSYGLDMVNASDVLPFWIDASLSWRTLLYAGALTIFGAAIVGILPALRVTRVNIQDALKGESAGRAGLKFGGFWTAVIVAQVAITVLFIPLAAGGVFESNRFNQRAEGIGAERFLAAEVGIDREDYVVDSATFAGRARNSFDALERRLAAEPGVQAVAFADRMPIEDQFKYQIFVDSAAGAPVDGLRGSTLVHVSRGFFGAFGTSVIAGRDFASIEYETHGGRVLIVNEAFARNVFGQLNPVGQRIQIGGGEVDLGVEKQWFEVVGVVKNFGWQLPSRTEQSAMYRPTLPGGGRASSFVVRVRDPEAFSNRLRQITSEVDPTIRLSSVQLLGKVGGGEAQANWALTAVAWLVGFMVLLLSAMGIHALMSFTVARRTREIGIRVALGADAGKIVRGIFSRAFLQIGAGIAIGSALAALAGFGDTRQMLLLVAADAIMLAVGLVACAVPVRRALSIHPTEALRAE